MPYSNCFTNPTRTCRIAPGSKRYNECINRKVAYNGIKFADALVRNVEKVKALDSEED